jgi:hypothetical protein
MNTMHHLGIASLLLLLTSTTTLGQTTSHSLDGKVFAVHFGLQGEAASSADEYIFKDGTFRAVGCDQWGFGEGVVRTSVDEDAIRFQTETTSLEHGNIAWQGVIRGDTIEGTYTWTKKGFFGTKQQDKWFKGTLKNSS